jgi:hypothetical protein
VTAPNPVPLSSIAKIRRASANFEEFTGHDAEYLEELRHEWPEVAFKFGMCDAIEYEATRDGVKEYYRHEFKKASRPILISDYDGNTIAIVGGRYRFTERGIEDY